jgi:hypothetical protein
VIVERPALERRVVASLEAGRIPVLLGGCGTGRTSLLLRLEALLGEDRSQYLDMAAAATTPERCVLAIRAAARLGPLPPETMPGTTRAAADSLFDYFDRVETPSGPATFLLDEFLDLRTFENFPGLRQIQRELVTRWAASPSRFVLASRFTFRVHRLLRDAPARFEVIHMPPLDVAEVHAMAERLDGVRRHWTPDVAPAVAALSGGLPSAAHILLTSLASMGAASDSVAALAGAMAPDGALTARCRECYEFRLHRARGYGALKAILGVLADSEPQNLTDIAKALHRTPGSTKDYLSWLEDVDLITVRGKRYVFTEPLVRMYVRLYGKPVPPTDDEIVREVSAFARMRLALAPAPQLVATQTHAPVTKPASVETARVVEPVADAGRSGIIEID